jgi:hypothetical protein
MAAVDTDNAGYAFTLEALRVALAAAAPRQLASPLAPSTQVVGAAAGGGFAYGSVCRTLFMMETTIINFTLFNESIIKPCGTSTHNTINILNAIVPQVFCYPIAYSHIFPR